MNKIIIVAIIFAFLTLDLRAQKVDPKKFSILSVSKKIKLSEKDILNLLSNVHTKKALDSVLNARLSVYNPCLIKIYERTDNGFNIWQYPDDALHPPNYGKSSGTFSRGTMSAGLVEKSDISNFFSDTLAIYGQFNLAVQPALTIPLKNIRVILPQSTDMREQVLMFNISGEKMSFGDSKLAPGCNTARLLSLADTSITSNTFVIRRLTDQDKTDVSNLYKLINNDNKQTALTELSLFVTRNFGKMTIDDLLKLIEAR